MNNIVPKWIRGSEWSFLNTSDYPVVNFFFFPFLYDEHVSTSTVVKRAFNFKQELKGVGGKASLLFPFSSSIFEFLLSLFNFSFPIFWLALGAPEAPTSLTSLSPSTVPLLFFFRPSLYSSAGVREPHQHVDNYTLLYDHVVYFLTQFIFFKINAYGNNFLKWCSKRTYCTIFKCSTSNGRRLEVGRGQVAFRRWLDFSLLAHLADWILPGTRQMWWEPIGPWLINFPTLTWCLSPPTLFLFFLLSLPPFAFFIIYTPESFSGHDARHP